MCDTIIQSFKNQIKQRDAELLEWAQRYDDANLFHQQRTYDLCLKVDTLKTEIVLLHKLELARMYAANEL